jgi:regulator of protease activity HflC (stomatin/prohibitin superfamily)
MNVVIAIVVVVVLLGLILSAATFRLVQQYERGVVLRFGRLLPAVRGPGLRTIVPVADRMRKVSIQTVVLGIPSQGTITRDNVTIGVDAVVYFRVEDPVRAVINVENYVQATSQVAQTSLRSVIGRSDLDTLLSDRARINAELRDVIDAPTEEWGIVVERVEIKDISLPESMRRSMSRQAEAERDRRARVIAADGELQASSKLSQAAGTMSDTPGALQLRLLQTVTDVAAEKNSTLVMPFPVELLRFFEHATGGTLGARTTAADAAQAEGSTVNAERSTVNRAVEPLPDVAVPGSADVPDPADIPEPAAIPEPVALPEPSTFTTDVPADRR